MARKIVVECIDDIDGTPIKNGNGETIAFSVDGVDCEIDLKDKNAREFRSILTYYIEHATRVGGRKRRSTPSVETSQGRKRAKEIREWRPRRAISCPRADVSPLKSRKRTAPLTESTPSREFDKQPPASSLRVGRRLWQFQGQEADDASISAWRWLAPSPPIRRVSAIDSSSRSFAAFTDPTPGRALSSAETFVFFTISSVSAFVSTASTLRSPAFTAERSSLRALRASAAFASASARCSGVKTGSAMMVLLVALFGQIVWLSLAIVPGGTDMSAS